MINLKFFCNDQRPKISKPFVDNGFKYACDGQILIAIKTDEPDSEGNHPEKAHELFERGWDQGWSEIIMSMPDKSDHACQFCEGDGKARVACDMCRGTGLHECDCGNEHMCGYCDKGYVVAGDGNSCLECGGDGIAYKNQQYGLTYFAGRHIAKIMRLLPNPRVTEMASDEVLRFEFDGGKGLLMALTGDVYER